jgi:hypothetical protein
MAMEYASVEPELVTLLRDRPLGTNAELNKYTVAYWDGHEVRGIHLHHDNNGRLAAGTSMVRSLALRNQPTSLLVRNA